MTKSLVIVESPRKADLIGRFLRASGNGDEVVVEASVGHIRDLPGSSKDLPERFKKEPWAYLAVNIEKEFEPIYVVSKRARDTVKKLKAALADADELYLATDEDREGEAIAFHLTEVLKPKVPVKRMVFHEITESAIREAFDNPRDVDHRLVDAQETRRVLDRLVGYDVSRVLWLKVSRGLSAGRVQSVAVRIVVERERERMAFRSASYWDIEGTFEGGDDSTQFGGTLVAVDGSRVATGKDFSSTGQLSTEAVALDREGAEALAGALDGVDFEVRSTETKPYTRKPYAPFRTSTLQQEASRKLRFSSQRTMSVAQRLYENGYITYMRTDSVTLSEAAIATAREAIGKQYGPEYVPDTPRAYTSKSKNAQEAHEAIRPAGEEWKTPAQVHAELGGDEAKLYELVWKRTLACQMPDARGETVSYRLGATSTDGRDVTFASSGRVITFPGFLKVYVESLDDPDADADDTEHRLPPLSEGDRVAVVALEPTGHETQPPRRFTEASLVQRLEELEVGRPSTYASIMSRIQDAGYVFKRGQALIPTFTAFAVVTLLEQHFPHLVDYAFTARMEDDLDAIASGDEDRVPWLTRFYLGAEGLKQTIEDKLGEIDARAVNSIPIGADDQNRMIVARVGRYGPYVERDETDRGSIPDDIAPDELTIDKANELIDDQSKGDKILGTDPDSGLVVLARTGRFGPYVQLGEQEEGSKEKPKRASLFKAMELDSLSLDDALQLLSLPRTVGQDDDGNDILALNGRYGPYIQRGDDRRSLESEEQLFSLTVPEALELFAQPPRRRGQRSTAPLRELGEDPVSKKPVTVKNGRYGPYVTDGEVNASLRKGDSPESITLDRAAELLQARRDRLASS